MIMVLFSENSSNNNLTNNNASVNGRGIYLRSSSSGNILSGNTVNSNSGTGIHSGKCWQITTLQATQQVQIPVRDLSAEFQ